MLSKSLNVTSIIWCIHFMWKGKQGGWRKKKEENKSVREHTVFIEYMGSIRYWSIFFNFIFGFKKDFSSMLWSVNKIAIQIE